MSATQTLPDDQLTSEAFYEKFRKEYLASYDFFRLLFAKLSLKGMTLLKSNKLKNFIYRIKNDGQYGSLLKDVHIYFNGISYVSKDIEKNFNTLQILGVLGRVNPNYETMIIYYSQSSAESTIEQFETYNEDMESLVDDFIAFNEGE